MDNEMMALRHALTQDATHCLEMEALHLARANRLEKKLNKLHAEMVREQNEAHWQDVWYRHNMNRIKEIDGEMPCGKALELYCREIDPEAAERFYGPAK